MPAITETNPLLEIEFKIPFDRIRAQDIEPAIQELLQQSRARIEQIVADPKPRTFDSTMMELDTATEGLEYAMGIVRHLEAVVTTPDLRAAHNKVQPEVSAFYSSIPLNEGLWRALQAYAATADAQSLTGTRKRFLTKTIDNFRRHGADLDPEGKARLSEIDVELSKVTTRFGENVLDSTNVFELLVTDETQLAGLPESARDAAKESARSKDLDGWRFTLQQPSYIALMTYLDDARIRERVWRAYFNRAIEPERDNRSLINEILRLRRAKASLLGFRDFADLVLEDRMAHTGERAQGFLLDLKQKTERRFSEENSELVEFSKEYALDPWDVGYYAEKQRAALYDFDEEELRPYFPLDNVVRGMFDIAGRLYGIQVVERPGVPAWDRDVKYYEIHDDGGGLLGAFYADWFPRENKRGGAWMDAFITGVDFGNRLTPHAGLICGNLTPPVAGRPALLTHREVETIFHEFGHLLHHCLSRVEVRSLAGTSVAWDFVELPSQIMENWCWEREALDLFARHYKTGEPIPEDLFRKMLRARRFRAANAQMRQLGFGFVDLALHRQYSPERDGEVMEYARNLLQPFVPVELPREYNMMAGFTHLFASPVGYGAGYYSYKWAEVLDADAFTRFREEGIFSRDTGLRFRRGILERGDSEDPAELYRGFMGRDPDPNALLERSGLLVRG
jgi:oligopeptidase A